MNKKVLRFILDLLKPYKIRIIIVSVCMIFVSLLGILSPLLQRILFDDGIVAGNLNIVIKYTLIIIALFLIEQIFEFLQFIHYEYINKQIPFNLLYRAVNHSIELKVAYHKDNNFTKTINNVYSDVSNITQTVNASLLQAAISFFKIIGGIIGLCLISWKLTIFILTIIPLEIFIKNFISSKRTKHTKTIMKLNEKFSIWFSETFKSIEIIKLWNLQKKRKDEFNMLQKEMIKTETKIDYNDNFSQISSQMLSILFSHGLNLLGAILILKSKFTIGGLFAFTAYSMYVMQPIALLANIAYKLNSSIPAFKRFMDYFDNDIEILEGISINDECHDIEYFSFENVVFGYDNKDSVLKSINFSIHKGEKVGFVGVNGSGKSSIINLLLRFFEPTSGKICLNGIDIQNIALNEYRNLFSVMNQTISLFDDSIRNNVNILNDLTEDQIHYYLDLATASDFVNLLPNGLDTFVGFNGSKLSGGEKQKVSLARTLAKKSKILILDEATASFDIGAEKKFDKYITQSHIYDIVIVISHREDILKGLDKIFVVENGVIIASGTFYELAAKSNIFNTILTQEKEKSA